MKKDEIVNKIVAIVEKKSKGDTSVLDEAVIDAKCGEASEINNGGFDAQVEYLCQGMTFEEAKKFIEETLA